MESGKLSAGGRLICPFLRPNFITRRQYESLVKTGESLIGAIDRMEQMVLASPTLLARLDLLPAEKMLASIDPGYQALEVAARLDTHLDQRQPALRAIQRRFAHRRRLCRRPGRPVLRGSADEGTSQEIRPHQGRQPEAFIAGIAEVVQAVRRHQEAEYRHRRIPAGVSFRAERVRAVPRFLPRGRLRGGDRFARAAGIPQPRAAPRRLRNRPGLPPPGRAGIPDPLRPDAPAGAGVSRPRGLRGQQLPFGAGAQEGHVRPADRRNAHRQVPGSRAQSHPRARAVDSPGAAPPKPPTTTRPSICWNSSSRIARS